MLAKTISRKRRAKQKPRQRTGFLFGGMLGGAVDLVENGYTIEQIMRKGDWKSVEADFRYVMAE